MGSARLAARHFQPVPLLTTSTLMNDHPRVARSRAPRRGRLERDWIFSHSRQHMNRLDTMHAPGHRSGRSCLHCLGGVLGRRGPGRGRRRTDRHRSIRPAETGQSFWQRVGLRSHLCRQIAKRADQGAGLCLSRAGKLGRRAAVRAQLVSAGAVFCHGRRETGSPVNRCESIRGSDGFPGTGSTSSSRAGMPSRPSSGSISTPTRSATAKATPTARSCMPELDPKKEGKGYPHGRPYGQATPISDDRANQAGRAAQREALGLSPPPDQASRGGHLAQGDAERGQQDQACRRFTSSPGSAAITRWPRASRRALGRLLARISSGWCSIPTAAPAIMSSPTARPTAPAARPWWKSSFPISSAHSRPSPIPAPACSTAIPPAAGAASGCR